MIFFADSSSCSRANERERQAIMTERDRQNSSLRTYESDLHAMEKKENTLSNQIRDKDDMEERIITMANEVTALNSKLKVCVCIYRHLTARQCLFAGTGR
jgi:predicted DNA-binding protein YlxM (UPF0122 family)